MGKLNRTVLLDNRPGIPEIAKLPDAVTIDIQEIVNSFERKEIDLICVLGPTASGKTKYAVRLAKEISNIRHKKEVNPISAEIISADSRQVYKGMDIGTGKDLEEYDNIPYHLIDIAKAGEKYSIYDYQRDFENSYKEIINRGNIPILCGGSGLYIEAATCGYMLPSIPPDYDLRNSLQEKSPIELRNMLLKMRPNTSEGTLQSTRRVIRALEVAMYEDNSDVSIERTYILPKNTFYIGTLVSREERVRRIDERFDKRIDEGMIEEVRGLIRDGVPAENLIYYGLEYKYITNYIMGVISYDEMKILLTNAIHQFAKRQMTWFRGMERDGLNIHWVKP